MTLGDFFDFVLQNPFYILYYFSAIPLGALLANYLGKNEGHLSPWNWFYTLLIYLVAVPGIFSVILNLYHLLFENHSIYDLNLLLQVLPVVSLVLTLYIISKNVNFDDIPGFGRMVNLLSLIAAVMLILFILEKLRLVLFTYIPFSLFILLLIGLFVLIRYGTRFLFK